MIAPNKPLAQALQPNFGAAVPDKEALAIKAQQDIILAQQLQEWLQHPVTQQKLELLGFCHTHALKRAQYLSGSVEHGGQSILLLREANGFGQALDLLTQPGGKAELEAALNNQAAAQQNSGNTPNN